MENSPEMIQALKIVLKCEIQSLLQRLADTGEESVVVTASAIDASTSHLCSTKGEGFIELSNINEIKKQFLFFCSGFHEGSQSTQAVRRTEFQQSCFPQHRKKKFFPPSASHQGSSSSLSTWQGCSGAPDVSIKNIVKVPKQRQMSHDMNLFQRDRGKDIDSVPHMGQMSMYMSPDGTVEYSTEDSVEVQEDFPVERQADIIRNMKLLEQVGNRQSTERKGTLKTSVIDLSEDDCMSDMEVLKQKPIVEAQKNSKTSKPYTEETHIFNKPVGNYGFDESLNAYKISEQISKYHKQEELQCKVKDTESTDIEEQNRMEYDQSYESPNLKNKLEIKEEPVDGPLSEFDVKFDRPSYHSTEKESVHSSKKDRRKYMRLDVGEQSGDGSFSASDEGVSQIAAAVPTQDAESTEASDASFEEKGHQDFSSGFSDLANSDWGQNQTVGSHTFETAFVEIGHMAKCLICEKVLYNKNNRKFHWRSHVGDKRYKCDICGKAFTHPSNMRSHRRTHTGEKPFGCEFCEKRYGRRDHLASHKLKYHIEHANVELTDVNT
ncbi:hypothetical protein ACJMK2_025423 [Sinanodonta woodiana]|uniref:C2H2-type domain-containing protein n=1 Tax=Sinanodonta woodiana TaxID=1069815 RepID=A0ABD3XK02_SINWO